MKILWFKYRNLYLVKVLLPFFVVLIFNACFSVKPSTTKSGKNYFETFYVGAEGNQYFIKPFSFINEETKEELIIDITFRYKNEINGLATANFSIEGQSLYKSIDSLTISNSQMNVKKSKVDLLFNEKTKKGFKSRFTIEIELAELKKMFDNDNWTFTIYSSNQVANFRQNKKSVKAIYVLREKVFILM